MMKKIFAFCCFAFAFGCAGAQALDAENSRDEYTPQSEYTQQNENTPQNEYTQQGEFAQEDNEAMMQTISDQVSALDQEVPEENQ